MSATNIVVCHPEDSVTLTAARELIRQYALALPFSIDLNHLDAEIPIYASDGALLVAYLGETPVGVIALRPVAESDTCEMKRLYVVPQHRGSDIGAELIRALQKEAHERGYKRMRLDTHAPSMSKAISLYKRLGFVEVDKPADLIVDPPPEIAADLVFMQADIGE